MTIAFIECYFLKPLPRRFPYWASFNQYNSPERGQLLPQIWRLRLTQVGRVEAPGSTPWPHSGCVPSATLYDTTASDKETEEKFMEPYNRSFSGWEVGEG